jgi:hypothetical protein
MIAMHAIHHMVSYGNHALTSRVSSRGGMGDKPPSNDSRGIYPALNLSVFLGNFFLVLKI